MKPALRVGIFVATILPALSSFGVAHHFTFLYEVNTSAPGNLELENWVTWRHATGYPSGHVSPLAFATGNSSLLCDPA